MNILNGTEAFAALAAGQQIECRHINAGEFDDIRNFPATVYINPEYEFRIAIKFFTIGEMQVPEPIKELPAKGVQCFVPSILTEELSKSFKWKNSTSDLALMQRGQVHLIKEHAITHALALIAVSGGSLEVPTTNDQNSTSNDVEEKASESLSDIQITEQGPADAKKSEPVQEEAPPVSEKKSKEVKAHYLDTFKCASSVVGVKHANEKAQSDPRLTDAHKKELELAAQKIIAEIEEHLANSAYVASQEKKPTSAELKKSFAKALNNAKSEREVAAIESQIESSFDLSESDKKYLAVNVQQMYDKFAPAETAPAENLSVSELQRLQAEAEKLVAQKEDVQQTPAVNEIKSNSIAGGLKTSIQDAANLDALTAVAQTIRDSKPKLTVDHMADVLHVYAARKKFLEDQQDMFADVQEPWVDGAIKRIEAAKNQDDINAEYSDPMCEELSDKDKQRLDLAAQKREAELFG